MRTLIGCGLSLALVAVTGCATTQGMDGATAEQDSRIERVEGTAATAVAAATEARARVDGVRVEYDRLDRESIERERRDQERTNAIAIRLTAIEQAVAEAREASRLARSRADEALARAEAADSRLTRLWANRHVRRPVNYLNIKFGFDDSALDDQSKSTLIALVHELRDNPTLTVDLEGFADPKGSRDYNLRLSRRRVEAVQRYLEEHGVTPRRINAIARGPLSDPALSDEHKRRVVVKIMLDAE